jgi:toxin ParE1/3/4
VIFKIEYTGPASRDLREAERYIRAEGGDLIADQFVLDIVAKVRSLRNSPTRQRLRTKLGVGLRAVSVGKFLIFYVVDGNTVRIARILHGARNISEKLFR